MIQVKTDNFEGPMDLLVHLVEKNKMEISEVNITQIIDDYLEYINKNKEENLKFKVEFLIMATDLIEIKAHSLLNKNNKVKKIERLEKLITEYKLFKEISELFSEREEASNISYKKFGNRNMNEAQIEYDLSTLTADNLLKSLKNITERLSIGKEKFTLNLEDEYSSEEGFSEIKSLIEKENVIDFGSLLKNKFSKSRIVVLFLCVLEMFKNGEIDITFNQTDFYIHKSV